jgi:hypothetical protein
MSGTVVFLRWGHRLIFGLNGQVRASDDNPVTLTHTDVTELLDAIRAGGDIDVIRKRLSLLQVLIDAEVTEHIGAGRRRWGVRRRG